MHDIRHDMNYMLPHFFEEKTPPSTGLNEPDSKYFIIDFSYKRENKTTLYFLIGEKNTDRVQGYCISMTDEKFNLFDSPPDIVKKYHKIKLEEAKRIFPSHKFKKKTYGVE